MFTRGTDHQNQSQATADILLPAVTITFGLQCWRVLVSLLVSVLRNRFGWNAAEVGAIAFAVLCAGFLAAPTRRRLGAGKTLAITAGGTGIIRLALQAWTGDPALELLLALAGSVLFAIALVTFASRRRETGTGDHFLLGALFGLALDLALHGFWRTYDLSWQSDAVTLAVIAVLFFIQVTLLWLALRRPRKERDRPLPLPSSLVWLGVGPYFLLALLAGQNVARLTVMTGWRQAPVYLWMAAVQALALVGIIWLQRRASANIRTVSAVGLLMLLGGLLPPWPAGLAAAAGYLLLYAGSALALLALLRGLSADRRARRWPVPLAQSAAVILFLFFLYFNHFGGGPASPSPFAGRLLPLLTALLLAIPLLNLTLPAPHPAPGSETSWRPALLAVALLALPLYRMTTVERPAARDGRLPLRVMTYNVHNGFDLDGHLGLEALAAVVQAQDPDVVLLQEVSRGLIIYSPTDMLTWFAQRLGMHAHFAPTADALWGLGTLSRVPIADGGSTPLPSADLLIRRGIEWIEVDVGQAGRLTVVNTHFHHLQRDGDVRVVQARALVTAWQDTSPLIVGGDLNARPDTPEIARFFDAGWQDVVGAKGPHPGYTFSSDAPYERIDYLWLSSGLSAAKIAIPFSTASDHLPVVATIHLAATE